jgi:hypothetical protein
MDRLGGWSGLGLSRAAVCCALATVCCSLAAPVAQGQLRPEQVLVVYDSRLPDSLAVAEYYAGSAKVPGGAGGRAGVRPGVRAVNIASLTGVVFSSSDLSYANFIAGLRDPLRGWLSAQALEGEIRCIVLTKGLPHRLQDLNWAPLGDAPVSASDAMNQGNYTAASVDSELTLLWQNLSAGEANGMGDSKADGGIVNPYARQSVSINGFSTANITSAKQFLVASGLGTGQGWISNATNPAQKLSPGDMYLVCRLDGPDVASVLAMIDRAQGLLLNVNTAGVVLDEGASNGLADGSPNSEYDNQGPSETRPSGTEGDDYESTRSAFVNDRRLVSANILYNSLGGASQFIVGPRALPANLGGQVITGGITTSLPIVLLATEGANHVGGTPTNGGWGYPFSFNYAPGAIFNTIESYNGRKFGTITTNGFGQADASDFIASGGTFAVAQVWEPFAFSVADNLYLARSFVLGSLSWAEAAYTSIPLLSWQQIVLGDPLARMSRSSEDIDGDGRVGFEDLVAWNRAPRDINRDTLANANDRRLIENSVRGPEAANLAGSQLARPR